MPFSIYSVLPLIVNAETHVSNNDTAQVYNQISSFYDLLKQDLDVEDGNVPIGEMRLNTNDHQDIIDTFRYLDTQGNNQQSILARLLNIISHCESNLSNMTPQQNAVIADIMEFVEINEDLIAPIPQSVGHHGLPFDQLSELTAQRMRDANLQREISRKRTHSEAFNPNDTPRNTGNGAGGDGPSR